MSGARGDSLSIGGVVRAEREAAGRAIGCAARVSVPGGRDEAVVPLSAGSSSWNREKP